jgi:putative ABC transport system permease protein
MRDLRFWRWRKAEDDDVERELEIHLALEVEEQLERGVLLREAKLAARREFGSVALTKEELRDMRMGAALDQLWQDLRYAARTLRKAPSFTLASVFVLALGIGATTAIFGLVDAALIRPLPFRDSQQLVMLWERSARTATNPVGLANFFDWNEQNRSFASMAAIAGSVALAPLADEGGGPPDTVTIQSVTSRFFDVLAVTPIAGRTFDERDVGDISGRIFSDVVVVSERLWRTRFGADPSLVGRTIRAGSAGSPRPVIGIVPASFQLLGAADVWELFQVGRDDPRGARYLQVIARLKPEATIERARADMTSIAARIEQTAPTTNRGWSVTITPLQEAIVGDELRTTSLLLGGVVMFVLLLACANVANLILARGIGRTREIAVRAALGGSRARIITQLLTESALLGGLGGVVGLVVSWGLLRVAPSLIPPGTIPESIVLSVNWRLGAFAMVATLATGLLFGLAPAWHAAHVPLIEAMSGGGRGSTDRAARIRQTLAVIEIAAALLLLTGAGLLVRTLITLNAVDAGYRADRVVTMSIRVAFGRLAAQSQLSSYYQRIEDEIARVPGVRAASIGTDVPLAGLTLRQPFDIAGDPVSDPANRPNAHYQIVSPRYFDALGIALLRGRAFTSRDATAGIQVCIVNEEIARRYFPSGDPIGARINVSTVGLPPKQVTREIVGVVRQLKTRPDERSDNAFEIYVPLAQNAINFATLAIRSVGDPMQLVPAIKKAIARVDNVQVASRIRTMQEIAAESTARPRFRAQLVGALAALATALAAVGIFSVLTFMVQQRAREFSIRLALGADASDLLRLVLGNAITLTAVGLALGFVASGLLVRSLASLLFSIDPIDPVTFAAAPAVLAFIALLACVAPALRALRSDPAVALREQ